MKKLMSKAHSMMSAANIRKAKTKEEKTARLSDARYIQLYNEEIERREKNWAKILEKTKTP